MDSFSVGIKEIPDEILGDKEAIQEWAEALLLSKVPKWVMEDYPGAEQEFTAWYEEIAKRTEFRLMIQKAHGDRKAQGLVSAQLDAWVSVRTRMVKGVSDRALIHQLYKAHKNGTYHYIPGEPDTIQEYIAQIFGDLDEGSSEWYEYRAIVTRIMPALKQIGAKPEEVIGMATSTSKARASVAAFNHILNTQVSDDGVVTPQGAQEALNLVRQVSDPTVKVSAFRDEVKRVKGNIIPKSLEPIPAKKFHMPGGETWLLFKAPSNAYVRAAEIGLKGVTGNQVDVSDPKSFVYEAAGLLMKRVHVDQDMNVTIPGQSMIDKFLSQPIHS